MLLTNFFLPDTHTHTSIIRTKTRQRTETLPVLTFILSDECWEIMVFSSTFQRARSSSYVDSSGHFFVKTILLSLSLFLSHWPPHSLQKLTAAYMVATGKQWSELLFQNSEAGFKHIRVEGRSGSHGWSNFHMACRSCPLDDL